VREDVGHVVERSKDHGYPRHLDDGSHEFPPFVVRTALAEGAWLGGRFGRLSHQRDGHPEIRKERCVILAAEGSELNRDQNVRDEDSCREPPCGLQA